MRKRLCIGLISPSDFLISILESIGVWYEIADLKTELNKYVHLIIDGSSSLSHDEILVVNNFIQQNGLILELSSKPTFYSKTLNRSFTKTVFNKTSNTEFDRVSHLDVYTTCSYSNSNILSGLIDFEKSHQTGVIGFIGIDLANLPANTESTRKRFLSPYGLYPDEIVNKVSLDSLHDIIELCIQHLLFQQNLPFIKKWISPKRHPVFGFRIDSDYGTKDSLQKIQSLLALHAIKATWFLHVQAHENWLEFFKNMPDQELALHGYQHGYSGSFSDIKSNIQQGFSKLKEIDINPNGFCAPYGMWNKSLANVLEHFDFKYTSEFSTGYDSVPFYQENFKNLQIPVHPICTGSLSRKRYSMDSIQQYFLHIYENKKKLFKPIIFYHHPLQVGFEIFEKIFQQVNSDQLTNLTFEEYAGFWNRRAQSRFTASVKDDKVEITSASSSLLLYISQTPESFDLISSKNQILSKEINSTFKYETPSLPSLDELQKLHHNRFDLMKTSFIDWKNRHRL